MKSLIPAEKTNLASPVEIRFLLPSLPWFETFQVAFLWECMALGQSDSRKRENVWHKAPSNVLLHRIHYSMLPRLTQQCNSHIILNMWPIKFYALLQLRQQNKRGNMSFMGYGRINAKGKDRSAWFLSAIKKNPGLTTIFANLTLNR